MVVALLSISFGPTVAAKTLFALCQHAFVAWDEFMRRELVPDASGATYIEFLQGVRNNLKQIA